MRRPYLVTLAVLCCAGIAYATGSITVTGYPAVPRTLKGGPGISIGADGTFTATGDAIVTGTQPFENLSSALRGKYLDKTGTATNASAYKGNAAPNATEFSYLQGVTSAIQGQLNGKADTSSLSLVATTGQYSNLSGKPALSTVATSGAYSDLTGKPTLATVATSGDYADLANKPTLATVAGTGSYTDLTNKPTIPAAQVNSDWNATTGVTKINNKPTLATVATSGNYSDLNGKPATYSLPTATTTVLGGVKIDGSSIQIDGAGVIRSTVAAGVSEVNGYTGVINLQTTDIVGFGNYSASVNAKFAAKMDNVNPSYSGTIGTTNPDGSHFSWDYNTTACPTTDVPEGAKCTLPSGVWWYKSGVWTQTGLVPVYTLPTASASTLGGVKVGTNLSVDGSGVLSAANYTLPTADAGTLGGVKVGSGLAIDGSGILSAQGGITIRPAFAGAQSVTVGNAYTTSATATLTLANHNAGSMTVSAGADTKIVPDASGSTFAWRNPITGVLNTTSAGWSIIIPSGSYAVIDSDGTGVFRCKLTTKNLQTGVNEYTTPVPIASASPTTLDFGSVTAGSTSSALSTVVTNAGTAALVTGAPYFSGTDAARFTVSANGCNAATLAPAATCTESVTFTPSAAGSYSAQLNIPHNAAGSPTVVAITGTGVDPTDIYTTEFASNWDSAVNPVDGGPNTWTTETDTNSSMSVSLAALHTLLNGTAYLSKTALTPRTSLKAAWDVNFSTVTGVATASGKALTMFDLKTSSLTQASVYLSSGTGTNLTKIGMTCFDDAASSHDTAAAYSFAPGTAYHVELLVDRNAGAGKCELKINGASIITATGLTNATRTYDRMYLGNSYSTFGTAGVLGYDIDNFVMGYK